MSLRFFQLIGWISLLLALGTAGASDQGALTTIQIISGGAIGLGGILFALWGQCMVIARWKHSTRREQRIPIRVSSQFSQDYH